MRYTVQIACHELPFWAPDDEHADRVARTWVRLFWRRYLKRLQTRNAGSIALATAEGWYESPIVKIWRHPESSTPGIIGAGPCTQVATYEVASVLA